MTIHEKKYQHPRNYRSILSMVSCRVSTVVSHLCCPTVSGPAESAAQMAVLSRPERRRLGSETNLAKGVGSLSQHVLRFFGSQDHITWGFGVPFNLRARGGGYSGGAITQCLRFLVPKSFRAWFLGPKTLNIRYLDPQGGVVHTALSGTYGGALGSLGPEGVHTKGSKQL